jgi:predicted RecB family nuclease
VNKTLTAYTSGACKLCHWYSSCFAAIKAADDLTLIPELGRFTREVMAAEIGTVSDLAGINPDAYIVGKKTKFAGIGPDRLRKFQERAQLLHHPKPRPYLREALQLPTHELEVFFDIEIDPMRDNCYLHGFVERRAGDNETERFIAFFTPDTTPAAKKEAFADAWRYMQQVQPCAIYYYSKYERTIYRKLQAKYPDVCSAEDIEALFDPRNAVDLYFRSSGNRVGYFARNSYSREHANENLEP